MDVLSDVLRVVRLSGAVFFVTDFTEPWMISSPPVDELAKILLPRAESISLFHVLAAGHCWVGYGGREPIEMNAGDVVVFPNAKQHFMGSAPRGVCKPITEIVQLARPSRIERIHHGGGGALSTFVCGYLQCDQRFNPLMETLPEMIHVRRADGKPWINSTLERVIKEAESPHDGSSVMLSRITELLFMEILRLYMERMTGGESGWFSGLKDRDVGRSLQLMHAEPARDWTVEELSRQVGVSRSLLAERFTSLIGISPIRYLSGWRMQLARFLLIEENLSLNEVAQRVGYESDAAFNRAFKRIVGAPPATWRRNRLSV